MELVGFLFKTQEHQRLAELLWTRGFTASVHELALMSGLPYATAYEFLHKMEKKGLVKKNPKGRATLFSSNLSSEEARSLVKLMRPQQSKKKSLADFDEMNLPLVGEFPELEKEHAQNLEELLVKMVSLAKKNSTLLRTLPLLVKRIGTKLDVHQLSYWSKRYQVGRELGFVLVLTSELSKEPKYARLARKFHDKRWSKVTAFLDQESKLSGFQGRLVEKNTPELAKKWFLKMNMGLEAFRSHYVKFA
jgi:hypothetical protein